ncbi:MAG: hypothetical protein ACRERD_06835, partial [Candidatus Binatia bacterium]
GFEVLREERVQTRLGSGLSGILPRPAVADTVKAVHEFLTEVRKKHNPRVLAVATSAVREATNRACLLDALKRNGGVEVQVLSGPEEARLGALAVLKTLSFRHGVIADLGGGSLQLTRVRSEEIVAVASLPLGAVRTTQRFLKHDPPTAPELRALREEIRNRVSEVLPPRQKDEEMVGLGGTVQALANMHLAACHKKPVSRQGLRLQQSHLTALRERLEVLPTRQRRLPGLKAERADIILAGAIVFEEIMILGGYTTLTVCTGGVRQGILLRETFNGNG